MTAEQLRRDVESHLGPETRLPMFLSIVAFVAQKIQAYGDRRSGWGYGFTKGAFNTQAEYTTGTIALAQSAAAVTGTGTSWATITNSRHKMRIGGVAYPITTIGGNTSITLTDNFAGDTLTAGTYSINKDEFELAALRSIYGVWDAQQNRRLECIPRSQLGDLDVGKDGGGNPTHYCIVGRGTSYVPIMQLFPYPTTITRIEYWYQGNFSGFSGEIAASPLPDHFDDCIRQGCLARAMQVLRRDGWREEFQLFERGIEEMWFQDKPQRETKVRMMRNDGLDWTNIDRIAWNEVTV